MIQNVLDVVSPGAAATGPENNTTDLSSGSTTNAPNITILGNESII